MATPLVATVWFVVGGVYYPIQNIATDKPTCTLFRKQDKNLVQLDNHVQILLKQEGGLVELPVWGNGWFDFADMFVLPDMFAV